MPANPVLRIADANVNRFRDGLRVIEDTLRFAVGRPSQWAAARRLRNDFSRLFAANYPAFLVARDSSSDPGRSSRQRTHSGIRDILRANFARCSEALRVLEEYSRLKSAGVFFPSDAELKRVRFRLYVIEKKSFAAQPHRR